MSETPFDLDGKTALVTGASRGIGRRLAVGLAEAGADLIVAGRSLERLGATCEMIRGAGRACRPVAADMSDSASIARMFDALAADGPMPEILVNNAGTEQVSPSIEVTPDHWDRIVDTNLKGAFFAAQAWAKALLDTGRPGSLINLGSLTSAVGVATAAPYTSSKSGLLGLTRALAAEWAVSGLRVNALGPGYFRTELTEAFYRDPEWRTTMMAKIPMRRFGQVDDLVGPAVFLASDASVYVTGQIIYVDGGTLAAL